MRLRITFAKTDAMRFTSHLDLHRAWERTIRRAGLPLAYSQGYSPHPHINLASALPLGFTGEQEVIDIWLESDLPLSEVLASLTRALPPGLQVSNIQAVDDKAPALQTELQASEYLITFLEAVPDLYKRIQGLLVANQLPRQWRGKPYDLRPLILELKSFPNNDNGQQYLIARLMAREGATGRPEEVISALGISPKITRVQRKYLVFRR
jgi:radical SAM-linked protein